MAGQGGCNPRKEGWKLLYARARYEVGVFRRPPRRVKIAGSAGRYVRRNPLADKLCKDEGPLRWGGCGGGVDRLVSFGAGSASGELRIVDLDLYGTRSPRRFWGLSLVPESRSSVRRRCHPRWHILVSTPCKLAWGRSLSMKSTFLREISFQAFVNKPEVHPQEVEGDLYYSSFVFPVVLVLECDFPPLGGHTQSLARSIRFIIIYSCPKFANMIDVLTLL